MSARAIRRERSRRLEREGSRTARLGKRLGATAAVSIGASGLLAQVAEAADFTVTDAGDAGPGTLRQAILDANGLAGDDRILFDSSISGDTITLATGQLAIDTSAGDLEILGAAGGGPTVSGNDTSRIFEATGGGQLSVSNLTLVNGYADSAASYGGAGGAIFSDGNLTVDNTAFDDNYSYGPGASINAGGAELTITDSTLENGYSYSFGGAVAAVDPAGTDVTITNTEFTGNYAQISGGAVFTKYAETTVSDSTVSGNEAGKYGSGGIRSYEGSLTISDTTLRNNAGKYAGAIGVIGGTLDFDRVTITNNDAGILGGGLFAIADGTVSDSTISGNTVNPSGGTYPVAIGGGMLAVAKYGTLEIAGSTISGNRAIADSGYPAIGGALLGYGAVVSNSTIADNFASGIGAAGLTVGGATDVMRSTIADNTSTEGVGGISAKYGGSAISRSTISGNQGAVGGIFSYDYSGAGPPDPTAALTLSNSTVSGNTAKGSSTTPGARSGYGGGVYLTGEAGGTIKNSTIAGNTAKLGGGGIFSYAGADSYDYAAQDRTLSSTIVADNNAAGAPNDLATDNSGAPGIGFSAGFSLIENPGSADLESNPAGSNITGKDPGLGALADNGGPTLTMKPAVGSPVIDKGTANGLLVDQRGEPRTTERGGPNAADGTDIGSVELPADTTPPVTTITSGPADGSTVIGDSVTFGFEANEPADFECQIDGGGFSACESPITFNDLSSTNHTFQVRATDDAGTGNVGNTASRSFKTIGGFCNGTPATIVAKPGVPTVGTAGRDVIVGTDGDDEINGRGGNDQICALDGDDVVLGGGGDDEITGDQGADQIDGQQGNDGLFGATGPDLIIGGSGDDTIEGANGDDRLRGRDGDDRIMGRNGRDDLRGNGGEDELDGGADDDNVRGDGGDDLIRGNGGEDELRGADGNDELRGAGKADDLFGGKGNDLLNGGKGRNSCDGGPGKNTLQNCN